MRRDFGKIWFHLVGLDSSGRPAKKAELNPAHIVEFFVNVPRALIGMEACPGSQWLARKLASLGMETNGRTVVMFKGRTDEGRKLCADLLYKVAAKEMLYSNSPELAKAMSTLQGRGGTN